MESRRRQCRSQDALANRPMAGRNICRGTVCRAPRVCRYSKDTEIFIIDVFDKHDPRGNHHSHSPDCLSPDNRSRDSPAIDFSRTSDLHSLRLQPDRPVRSAMPGVQPTVHASNRSTSIRFLYVKTVESPHSVRIRADSVATR